MDDSNQTHWSLSITQGNGESNMDNNISDFYENSIEELTIDEVEQVNGGWVPLVIAVVRIAVSPVGRSAIKGAIAAVSAYAGYSAVKAIKN